MYSVVEELYTAINKTNELIRSQIIELIGLNEDSMKKVKKEIVDMAKDTSIKLEKATDSGLNDMKQIIYNGLKQLDQRMALFDQSIEDRFKKEVEELKTTNTKQFNDLGNQVINLIQKETIDFQTTINKSLDNFSKAQSMRDKEMGNKLNTFPDMVTNLVRSGISDYTKIVNQKIEEIASQLTTHQKTTDQITRELKEQLALKVSQMNKRLDETVNRFKFVASQIG